VKNDEEKLFFLRKSILKKKSKKSLKRLCFQAFLHSVYRLPLALLWKACFNRKCLL